MAVCGSMITFHPEHARQEAGLDAFALPFHMKIKAGLKFRVQADVDDYKQMLRDGWAGSMDGLVEQIEGDTVFVRLVDGQAWRFLLKNFEEVTTPHDWQGEIMWD